MKHVPLILASIAAASIGLAAEAGNHSNGKGNPGKGNKGQNAVERSLIQENTVQRVPTGTTRVADCPPGLAKKNPPCVPPGQARKYGIGDVIYGDYRIIGNPGRYGLDPNESYYRVGDYIYRVDRETREVLDLIGAVSAVLD